MPSTPDWSALKRLNDPTDKLFVPNNEKKLIVLPMPIPNPFGDPFGNLSKAERKKKEVALRCKLCNRLNKICSRTWPCLQCVEAGKGRECNRNLVPKDQVDQEKLYAPTHGDVKVFLKRYTTPEEATWATSELELDAGASSFSGNRTKPALPPLDALFKKPHIGLEAPPTEPPSPAVGSGLDTTAVTPSATSETPSSKPRAPRRTRSPVTSEPPSVKKRRSTPSFTSSSTTRTHSRVPVIQSLTLDTFFSMPRVPNLAEPHASQVQREERSRLGSPSKGVVDAFANFKASDSIGCSSNGAEIDPVATFHVGSWGEAASRSPTVRCPAKTNSRPIEYSLSKPANTSSELNRPIASSHSGSPPMPDLDLKDSQLLSQQSRSRPSPASRSMTASLDGWLQGSPARSARRVKSGPMPRLTDNPPTRADPTVHRATSGLLKRRREPVEPVLEEEDESLKSSGIECLH